MTLTFWVNPIQKQKQPQNAENYQNGLKRDMLVNFAKSVHGVSKSWDGSCITTIYLGPRSDPAKKGLKWTLLSRNF